MHALQERYENGLWLPSLVELQFAEELARLHWTEAPIQAAKRTAPAGSDRLSLLLDNTAFVLRYAVARDLALLPLRNLVDVLADEADRQLPPSAEAARFNETRVQITDLHDGLFVDL
ncbi:hypothetical protein [Streptomyces griseorubiginosus]|uniref:hypothetical protein n=1 Tax=Streptomyces griseorubiginosus TaxID=67304 RepID=UPI0036EE017C